MHRAIVIIAVLLLMPVMHYHYNNNEYLCGNININNNQSLKIINKNVSICKNITIDDSGCLLIKNSTIKSNHTVNFYINGTLKLLNSKIDLNGVFHAFNACIIMKNSSINETSYLNINMNNSHLISYGSSIKYKRYAKGVEFLYKNASFNGSFINPGIINLSSSGNLLINRILFKMRIHGDIDSYNNITVYNKYYNNISIPVKRGYYNYSFSLKLKNPFPARDLGNIKYFYLFIPRGTADNLTIYNINISMYSNDSFYVFPWLYNVYFNGSKIELYNTSINDLYLLNSRAYSTYYISPFLNNSSLYLYIVPDIMFSNGTSYFNLKYNIIENKTQSYYNKMFHGLIYLIINKTRTYLGYYKINAGKTEFQMFIRPVNPYNKFIYHVNIKCPGITFNPGTVILYHKYKIMFTASGFNYTVKVNYSNETFIFHGNGTMNFSFYVDIYNKNIDFKITSHFSLYNYNLSRSFAYVFDTLPDASLKIDYKYTYIDSELKMNYTIINHGMPFSSVLSIRLNNVDVLSKRIIAGDDSFSFYYNSSNINNITISFYNRSVSFRPVHYYMFRIISNVPETVYLNKSILHGRIVKILSRNNVISFNVSYNNYYKTSKYYYIINISREKELFITWHAIYYDVFVKTNIKGFHLYVNNKEYNSTSDYFNLHLKQGNYTIIITKPGYKRLSYNIYVNGNETLYLTTGKTSYYYLYPLILIPFIAVYINHRRHVRCKNCGSVYYAKLDKCPVCLSKNKK
ncbi:PEGA domain-containing protein [Picrophilus oshimae]|uniref:PEGA domain-containing protein n=1 Tax=Picrophilus torridus (strain ATCC 700027 / DSM 9790 / JCM 10055 / NBRC 100828 / KAW 2/3) TaxID=1122961 RepID=A0A8G2FY65_PICTO|nr:PEGA domain-containing protein [Picrophilus oshimae]SMD31636.1 PEGA domain-containing protein [Picrophilus oshimae DSM 9789]